MPLALAVLWQALALWLDKQTILPRLDAVAAVLLHPTERILITGSLLENTAISLLRVILGFFLAVAAAVPLGMAMGYFKAVDQMVDSTVEMLRPIPPLAWVPLILAWLGIRGVPDVFPFLATSPLWAGIQFSHPDHYFHRRVFSHFAEHHPKACAAYPGSISSPPAPWALEGRPCSSRFSFPASLPLIVTGLRIGLGIGWMCLVAAEMMPGSSSGLGYLIWYAYELLRADIIVAGMVAIGVIGFIMDRGFRWLEGKLFWGGHGIEYAGIIKCCQGVFQHQRRSN